MRHPTTALPIDVDITIEAAIAEIRKIIKTIKTKTTLHYMEYLLSTEWWVFDWYVRQPESHIMIRIALRENAGTAVGRRVAGALEDIVIPLNDPDYFKKIKNFIKR